MTVVAVLNGLSSSAPLSRGVVTWPIYELPLAEPLAPSSSLHGGQTTHSGQRRLRRASVGRSLSRCGSQVLIWVVEWDVVQCYQHVVCCWMLFCGGVPQLLCDGFWRLFDVCFSSPNLSTVLAFSASVPARAESSMISLYARLFGRRPDCFLVIMQYALKL